MPPYNPMLPERANVYDIGVVQKVWPGLELGLDVYLKTARDLIDDGQFGAGQLTLQTDDDASRLAVLEGIVDGLLRDAVEIRRDGVVRDQNGFSALEPAIDMEKAGNSGRQFLKGRHQSVGFNADRR